MESVKLVPVITLAMPNGPEARFMPAEERESSGPITMEKFWMTVVAQNQALTRELAGLRKMVEGLRPKPNDNNYNYCDKYYKEKTAQRYLYDVRASIINCNSNLEKHRTKK